MKTAPMGDSDSSGANRRRAPGRAKMEAGMFGRLLCFFDRHRPVGEVRWNGRAQTGYCGRCSASIKRITGKRWRKDRW